MTLTSTGIPTNGFSSDEVKLLAEVFDQAWQLAESRGWNCGDSPATAREKLAKFLISLASEGERDAARLLGYASDYLASVHRDRVMKLV